MRSTSTTPAVWGATSARIALLAAALVGLLAAPLPDPTEAGASPRASSGAKLTKQLKKLKRRIGALEGRPIPIIPTSLPPSGPAGGALAGSYPNPTLNISGGPCANGQALTDVSSLAGLTRTHWCP